MNISSKLMESKEDILGIVDSSWVKDMSKTTWGLRLAPGVGSSLVGEPWGSKGIFGQIGSEVNGFRGDSTSVCYRIWCRNGHLLTWGVEHPVLMSEVLIVERVGKTVFPTAPAENRFLNSGRQKQSSAH